MSTEVIIQLISLSDIIPESLEMSKTSAALSINTKKYSINLSRYSWKVKLVKQNHFNAKVMGLYPN